MKHLKKITLPAKALKGDEEGDMKYCLESVFDDFIDGLFGCAGKDCGCDEEA
jgi:hypothetical protein